MSRTGSIKRSGSTWGFVLDVGRTNGRRQQVRKRGFRTRKDAQTALNEALAELQHGTYVRPQRITFGAYLDDWLATLAIAGRRPTTIAGYRRLIRVHVKPALGDLELQQITAVDLDRLYAQLASVGSPGGRGPLSKSTIRKVHVLIGKALGDAERKGLVQRNVARVASPPSARSREGTGDDVLDARTAANVPGLRRGRLASRADAATRSDDGLTPGRAVRAALARRRSRQRTSRRAPGDHDRRSRAVARRREVDDDRAESSTSTRRRSSVLQARSGRTNSRNGCAPGPSGSTPAWCSRCPTVAAGIPT